MTKREKEEFPSPTGDLYFSIGMKTALESITTARFRPLPGTYISQFEKHFSFLLSILFPSPTGDLYFSIGTVCDVMELQHDNRFRPLPGTYISQF